MRVLRMFDAPLSPCPYLPGQSWRMRYADLAEISPDECDSCLEDGWFKFGRQLQKPICDVCHACLSLRVPIDEWAPNRAQRRVLKRNADLEVRFGSPPVADIARTLLHNHYRASQHQERGWDFQGWETATYAAEFVSGPLPMAEITVWEGGRLRAAVLADVTADAVTGVTHYYDPSMRERSIGLFVMLQTFELARRYQKKWAYLGYFVAGSPTMDYKRQFTPCELLGNDGIWRRVETSDQMPEPDQWGEY